MHELSTPNRHEIPRGARKLVGDEQLSVAIAAIAIATATATATATAVAATAATATAATATATTTTTLGALLRLVHTKRATVEHGAVQLRDRAVSSLGGAHRDEGEATRLPGLAIG